MPSSSVGSLFAREYNEQHDNKLLNIKCTRREYRLIINALWSARTELFWDWEHSKKMSDLCILTEFTSREAWELHDRLNDKLRMLEIIDKQEELE